MWWIYFETVTADTGASGVAVARSLEPALIVLDLRLPDTDGFTVCQRLVDSPVTCHIPVIILSGMERPDIIRRSRAAGCSFFAKVHRQATTTGFLLRVDDGNVVAG